MIERRALVAHLQRTLQAMPEVDAAWEGGSAAFRSDDGLSDVDAVAVVADDAVEPTFVQVEAALGALSPVVLRHDAPAAPGFRQKFYRLRDAGEFLVVDLVLIRRSDPLPAAACSRIEALSYVRDLEDLADKQAQARAWFDRCMSRLRSQGTGAGLEGLL